MKVQDVMLQAMAKKITWWQAAEILGISDRHMRRWRERYVEEGYNGLLDRRRGRPSRRRVAVATVEKVFALYREKYFDLSVQAGGPLLVAKYNAVCLLALTEIAGGAPLLALFEKWPVQPPTPLT